MAGGKLRHYRLAPAAETDLEDIWLYTARNWSVEQADRYTDALEAAFDTLVAMPEIARERREFDPPVRVHPSAQHVIIYRIEADHLVMLRVLGGRQNWQAFLDLAN
jgi:toxin ParE1/3/4